MFIGVLQLKNSCWKMLQFPPLPCELLDDFLCLCVNQPPVGSHCTKVPTFVLQVKLFRRYRFWDMGVEPKNRGKTPQNGWFIVESPIKMDDLGVPLFLETPIFWFHVQYPLWDHLFFSFCIKIRKLSLPQASSTLSDKISLGFSKVFLIRLTKLSLLLAFWWMDNFSLSMSIQFCLTLKLTVRNCQVDAWKMILSFLGVGILSDTKCFREVPQLLILSRLQACRSPIGHWSSATGHWSPQREAWFTHHCPLVKHLGRFFGEPGTPMGCCYLGEARNPRRNCGFPSHFPEINRVFWALEPSNDECVSSGTFFL